MNATPNITSALNEGLTKKIYNSLSNQTMLYYVSTLLMIVLIVITITLVYTAGKLPTSKPLSNDSNMVLQIILPIFITFIVFAVLYYFLQNNEGFKTISQGFFGSSYLFLLLFYVLFLIVLFQNILTKSQIDEYAYIILPVTILFGVYLFYINISSTIQGFLLVNQLQDRIKFSIIYFCLLVFLILFYSVDPNQYISTYFGPYLIVSILLAVFGFLYLLVLMTYPKTDTGVTSSFISRFNPFTVISVVGFIIFLILITSGILAFPGGFFNSDPATITGIEILVILVCVFWLISLIVSLFSGYKTDSASSAEEKSLFGNYGDVIRNSLLLFFGMTFSGLLIYWIVTGVQTLTSRSGILSFILNLIIIIAVLAIVYQIIAGTAFYRNSPLLRLVINTVLYIPCILVSLVNNLVSLFGIAKSYSPSIPYSLLPSFKDLKLGSVAPNENTTVYFVYLGIIVLAIIGYLFAPYVELQVTDQGGKLLINQPIYLNNLKYLASYNILNDVTNVDLTNEMNPMNYNYNYGISFWVYLDSIKPNSMSTYTSILNFGNKPNILYNSKDNKLVFVVNKTNSDDINNVSQSDLTASGNQIVYENDSFPLQKWNHIVINYNGGTLDIFINGILEKSVYGVIPYKTMDILEVGSENGVQGGICNLNYFKDLLDAQQIYYLYNFFKNSTPPVHSSSQDTVINYLEQMPNINKSPIEVSSNTSYMDNLANTVESKKSSPSIVKQAEKAFETNFSYTPSNYISWDWYLKNKDYGNKYE